MMENLVAETNFICEYQKKMSKNVDGITDCWNKGWFYCTYEKTVDILVNAIDGGYEIEKLM